MRAKQKLNDYNKLLEHSNYHLLMMLYTTNVPLSKLCLSTVCTVMKTFVCVYIYVFSWECLVVVSYGFWKKEG